MRVQPSDLPGLHWVKSLLGCMYVGCSKSNASHLFPWKQQQVPWAQYCCSIEQILSYKTVIFNVVINISSAFWTVMNLHVMLLKTCTSGGQPLSPSAPPASSLFLWPLFGLHKCSQVLNANRCNFFCMEEFSATALHHMHFHVRCCYVRLPLCCHLSQGNNM